MKDYALGLTIGAVLFLILIMGTFIPSPAEARKDEMNVQLTRIADALELIASAVKTQ